MADLLSGNQIAIFYNGRVCICDITELQARAIIWHARQETEQKYKNPASLDPNMALPSLHLCGPPPDYSMKRSLQRFLQRRKNRIQATSPYNH